MVYYPKSNRKKRSNRGKKKTTLKSSKGVTAAVKSYVNKTIHKKIEDKTISDASQVDFGSYTFQPDMSVRQISPSPSALVIAQGAGQGGRVGNTITTRKLLLKYILYPNKQDDAVNPQPIPQEVMIWIGFLKGARVISPSAPSYSLFYQSGSTSVSPYSNLWDCMLPVNQDLFTICRTFRHKLGNEVYTDYAGIKPNNYFSNNDFKLNCTNTVDLTKYLNKVIKFDDASTQSDTGLYMWMTTVNADGSQSDTASRPVGMKYVIRYDYEDA